MEELDIYLSQSMTTLGEKLLKKKGCLTNNGSEDDKSKPEGLPKYVVLILSFLEPSEQNVGNSNTPEENRIEREEPIQFGDDSQIV